MLSRHAVAGGGHGLNICQPNRSHAVETLGLVWVLGMQQPQVIQRFLDKLLGHTRLYPDEQQAILSFCDHESLNPGDSDLIRRGDNVSFACLVVDGLLARTRTTASGKNQITAFYLPGDMPDIYALLTPIAATTLHAIVPTRVLRVPRATVRSAMQKFPAIAEALWRETMIDGIIATEWTVNIGQHEAKARLAHLFCEIVARSGAGTSGKFRVFFPVTQVNLADAAGMSPVHVNRTLQALRADQVVNLREQHIHVLDWNALRDMAEFDPGYLGLPEPLRLLF